MARIRKLELYNFRSIQKLVWFPSPNMNCLVGPGDSGKSTVLDAIDWCLGARRNLPVTDADFYNLSVDDEIIVRATIGDLQDGLKTLDTYGPFLLGLDKEGNLEDEPSEGSETVLTVQLTIGDDLEPQWQLKSDRAEAQGLSRGLTWGDRVNIAPNRIGVFANQHLGWQRGSILNALTEEKADASAALADAARQARNSFGDTAGDQLKDTLGIISGAAQALGVDVGDTVRAMLDAHSVNFSGSTISLHSSEGVPLRKLGLGSSRLLVAGLQNRVAETASIALVDEVEIGLEPHRISKFLLELGSKTEATLFQIFMTTHSPVVLRELSGPQLYVIRRGDEHSVVQAGVDDAIQGTLRIASEAFLGTNVLVCEGATEVGLVRGIDRYRAEGGRSTFAAAGGVLVDAGGVSKIYRSAMSFLKLGYNVATLRDDDVQPKEKDERDFVGVGGKVFKWTEGWAIEAELFDCVSDEAVLQLWSYAKELHGEQRILDHLRTACEGPIDLSNWFNEITEEKRRQLAAAAGSGSWFKRISHMEEAAYSIIGPDLDNCVHSELPDLLSEILKWSGAIDG